MATLWFWLVAILITGYVVLDGFDLGAGIIHLGVARKDSERRAVFASIGPFWDGNEVWLLAAGGTLYMAFPELYAASFSGFYLPLMVVLWLLILRGISIEFRSHIEDKLWQPIWDVVFTGSSALLAICLGAALGNVLRGVPIDASGSFFLPFWTNFGVEGEVGILDWYTVTVGLLSYVTLTHHGALWVAYRTQGEVRTRSRHIARLAWWAVAGLAAVVTLMTLGIQPQVGANLSDHPAGIVFPVLALAGLLSAFWFRRAGRDLAAFLGSVAFIVGMLTSAVFGVYPYVLPSNGDPSLGLTVTEAASPANGLSTALVWWIPGMLLVASYSFYIYRHFRGRVAES